jgi:hypothetical protein
MEAQIPFERQGADAENLVYFGKPYGDIDLERFL